MMRQFRLVHVGVAAALAAAAVTSVGLVQAVGAGPSGTASVFVPIAPCRLVDTRAGAENIGGRATPVRAAESVTLAVWGTNGNCSIPNVATGIAANVTAVNPTADSYLTVYPADAIPRPVASNLNYAAGSPPTPNQVTVGLSAAGAIAAYNNGGTVDVIIDIVGYYQAATGGAQGPQGLPGKDGAPGPTCPAAGCTLSFQGLSAAGYGGTSGNCVYGTTMRLPLTLPLGVVITKVTVRYIDTDPAAKLDFSLFQFKRSIGGAFAVATAAPSVDSGLSLDLALNNSAPLAVDGDLNYYVIATNGSGTGTVQLCGADITYHF